MDRRSWFAALCGLVAWLWGVKPVKPVNPVEYIWVALYQSRGKVHLLGLYDTWDEASRAQFAHLTGPDRPTGTYPFPLAIPCRRAGLTGFGYGQNAQS